MQRRARPLIEKRRRRVRVTLAPYSPFTNEEKKREEQTAVDPGADAYKGTVPHSPHHDPDAVLPEDPFQDREKKAG